MPQRKNDTWWDFTGSAYTDENEIQVRWTEYPGVRLALQEVKTYLHKEWLSVSYLMFYL